MDFLTHADLTALASPDQTGLAVSLFTPTSRVTDDLQADRLRWKNVIAAAATSLHDDGIDVDFVDALLAPAHGTGLASTDEAVIATAARDGRVDALFVASDPSCWNRIADSNPVAVRLGAEPDVAECELLDRAMSDTLLNSGEVYPVNDPSLLDGQAMAGTLRY